MSDVMTASHRFQEVEAYCMFLGYARSGHSRSDPCSMHTPMWS